jgi:hypothetical protein
MFLILCKKWLNKSVASKYRSDKFERLILLYSFLSDKYHGRIYCFRKNITANITALNKAHFIHNINAHFLVVCIKCSWGRRYTITTLFWRHLGIKVFFWKFLFARGVFSAIDDQQGITWCDEALLLLTTNCVFHDVAKMKQLII